MNELIKKNSVLFFSNTEQDTDQAEEQIELTKTEKQDKFEIAKNEIMAFSEQKEKELKIDTVETKGWLFSHKVTGAELNDRMETIQSHFIQLNKSQDKTKKVFGLVYEALEALDKNHLQRIIGNIKAIEKASNDIKKHQVFLENHQRTLDKQQQDTESLVAKMNKNLKILSAFKQKLDSLSHLTDIDNIWHDCQRWHRELKTLTTAMENARKSGQDNANAIKIVNQTLTTAEKNIDILSKQSSTLTKKLETVITFTTKLERITHLKDVDQMWDALSSADSELRNISKELDDVDKILTQNKKDITNLLSFMNQVSSLNHLMDVDEIWQKTENHQTRLHQIEQENKSHTRKLSELAETDAEIFDLVATNSDTIDKHTTQLIESKKLDDALAAQLEKNQQENNEKFEILTKKIKYAYWIAGGTAGLAIVELVLLFTR